jgi:hypothetical protein
VALDYSRPEKSGVMEYWKKLRYETPWIISFLHHSNTPTLQRGNMGCGHRLPVLDKLKKTRGHKPIFLIMSVHFCKVPMA